MGRKHTSLHFFSFADFVEEDEDEDGGPSSAPGVRKMPSTTSVQSDDERERQQDIVAVTAGDVAPVPSTSMSRAV